MAVYFLLTLAITHHLPARVARRVIPEPTFTPPRKIGWNLVWLAQTKLELRRIQNILDFHTMRLERCTILPQILRREVGIRRH